MVNFKIYDKRQNKFVGQHFAGKAWTVRYSLGIWNNRVSDTRLGEMYKIMNNNDKHLILYVKIDGRYKPVTKEIIATIENLHKKGEPERKASRKKFREESKQYIKCLKKRNTSSCKRPTRKITKTTTKTTTKTKTRK